MAITAAGALPLLLANTPAAAPPAAKATIATAHFFPRDDDAPAFAGRGDDCEGVSAMYWNDTVPARACSLAAMIRT
jgi:hypothetical protein